MNQLTFRVQSALDNAGFEAAVTRGGNQRFILGTGRSVIVVEATDDSKTVAVSSTASGMAFLKEYPAGMLERYSDEALEVLFHTIAAFA